MTTTSMQDQPDTTQDSAHIRGIVTGLSQVMTHLEPLALAHTEQRQESAPPPTKRAQPEPSIDLDDYTTWADGVTAGITAVIDKTLLPREAHFLWEVSADILNRRPRVRNAEDAPYVRLSSVLLLEALIASPTAVQNALQMLRALLLEEDPEVARLRAALEGGKAPLA